MDEITVGPRLYPPTLWCNQFVTTKPFERRNDDLLNHFVLLMHAIQR